LLDVARQHVADGGRIIAQQTKLIALLRETGRDTKEAERTLQLFEASLAIFEKPLARLEAKERGG
jgi:hypothetical protein